MSGVPRARGGHIAGVQGGFDCDRDASVRFQTLSYKLNWVTISICSEHIKSKPTHAQTISLLEAAGDLSCDPVIRQAKARLCELCDSRRLPSQLQHGDDRSWELMITTIRLAREHNLPSILKRIFYEVVSNEEYWTTYHKDRDSIYLTSMDRERLLCAREGLGRLWRDFVVIPPEASQKADGIDRPSTHRQGCCYRGREWGQTWMLFMVEKNELDRGALDPLRYNIIDHRLDNLVNEWWCVPCLRNKEKAWEEKKLDWWMLLDDLLWL